MPNTNPKAERWLKIPRPGWHLPWLTWVRPAVPNRWDLLVLGLTLGLLVLLAWGSRQMTQPYTPHAPPQVVLDPWALPLYGAYTTWRMGLAMVASILFSLPFAALAAHSRRAEKLLIPLLDVLQSVPILGYLSITVTLFTAVFPGSLLGMEMAAIFAIFTSQVWNLTFSMYQSFVTVPSDLVDAAHAFHFSRWQRFWRVDVPFALPNAIWNLMMSMSGGWFFIVASESISVAGRDVALPGIGSYIALAIRQENLRAVGYAILAMLVLIVLYDQLLFRPLLAWAEKFRYDADPVEKPRRSWVLTGINRARLMRRLRRRVLSLADRLLMASPTFIPAQSKTLPDDTGRQGHPGAWGNRLWNLMLGMAGLVALWSLVRFVTTEVELVEVAKVLGLGLITALRVFVMVLLATLVWVPVGVYIGLRPDLARLIQPLAQFLSAFPANLLFPAAVFLIVYFQLNPEIWISPLMILGTQWYILFNVIAGSQALNQDWLWASRNLGLKGFTRWRRLILPGIFPSLITGAVTATGGSWNASIVAEVVQWGSTRLEVTGIGAYIARWTAAGDFPRVALGIGILSLLVVVLNRLVWRPLYLLAETRMRMN